jgi:glycosyltransferase involved in cell wall biosynthesis
MIEPVNPSVDSMQEHPLVSIIIPTFNRGRFIAEAINSVLSQTYPNIELIVVDDGSTDETPAIIASIKDSRLHYVRQENRGRSNARNHALSLAKGKFITFLDSDDMYLPGKIDIQVDYLSRHPETGMVYTSALCINDAGETLPHKYIASVSGMIYNQIAFFQPVTITLPTVMTYKSVLDAVGVFDESMHRFEDTDMWRRIAKTYRIDAMPDFTCLLRTHDDNSLLNQKPEQIVAALAYYSSKINRDDKDISKEVRRRGLARLYRYYAAAMLSAPAPFPAFGKQLMQTAIEYDWQSVLVAWLARIPQSIRRLLRAAYYRSLNYLYAFYSRIKKFINR